MFKRVVIITSILVMQSYAHSDQYSQRDLESAFTQKDLAVVVVLGSGPAGYTAAMQTTRAGLPTLLIGGPNPGGQLMGTSMVENYPGVKRVAGSTIPETMAEQAYEFGASLMEDIVTTVDFSTWPFVLTTQNGRTVRALSVIIATGATPRKLNVPGENAYWGRGVSSCALCDCLFFKKKDVVIVGGGDAAVEEALQLAPFAKSVTILVRSNRMRAVNQMQAKLQDYKHVSVVYNKQVKAVLGNEKSVTGLEIEDGETGKRTVMKTDGLFLAIGQVPNSRLFEGQLELSPTGFVILEGRSQMTSVQGVFAAGDVEDDEIRQAIYSAGNGCRAGIEASRWLRKEVGLTGQMIEKHKANLVAPIQSQA